MKCCNCKYKDYVNELKKQNEYLLKELDVVKQDRDEIKEEIQKYIIKDIK